jgi:hypothetical protein
MSWLKWIVAHLFDCVHPHTTWPHRDRVGRRTYAVSIADKSYRIRCNK